MRTARTARPPPPDRRPYLVLVVDVCVGQLEGEQLVQHDPEGVDVTLERVRVLLLHSDYLRRHPQDAPCRKHRFTGLIGDPSTRGSGDDCAGFGPRSAAITYVQCWIETSTLNSRRVEIWKVREAHRLQVDKKMNTYLPRDYETLQSDIAVTRTEPQRTYLVLHLFSLRIGICSAQIGRLHWYRQLGYHSDKGRLIST